MANAEIIPSVTVRKGVPLPENAKMEERSIRDVILGLKKGESFILAPEHRNKALVSANYLKRKKGLPFSVVSRRVVEGGVPAIGIWRVED